MKTLIGGAIAAALGLIGIVVWWKPFLTVLAGTIPIMLLLGGALAIYLGFDELKESFKEDEVGDVSGTADENVEKYKKEIDDLKDEIEDLKKE
jgi:hypothetical protein